MGQTIYIKLNKSACIDGTDVFISDIAGVYCENRNIVNRVKADRKSTRLNSSHD